VQGELSSSCRFKPSLHQFEHLEWQKQIFASKNSTLIHIYSSKTTCHNCQQHWRSTSLKRNHQRRRPSPNM